MWKLGESESESWIMKEENVFSGICNGFLFFRGLALNSVILIYANYRKYIL
jgi:hypothetical protein